MARLSKSTSVKSAQHKVKDFTEADLAVLARGKTLVKTLCAKKLARAQANAAQMLQRAPRLADQAAAQIHKTCSEIEADRTVILALLSKLSLHKRVVLEESLSRSIYLLKKAHTFDDSSFSKLLSEWIKNRPPNVSMRRTGNFTGFYTRQRLDRCDLSKRDLSGAGFFSCSLKGTDLTHSVQAPTFLWQSKLTNANLLGVRMHSVCETVTHGVQVLALSRCGRIVACAGHRGMVTLWKPETVIFQASKKQVNALGFSDCSLYFWTGADDCCGVLWDLHSLVPVFSFTHSSEVLALAISNSYIAVGAWGTTNNLGLWKLFQNKPAASVAAHASSVRQICFSPSGRRLLSKADDHSIRLWSTPSLDQLWTVTGPSLLRSVAASPVAFLQSEETFVSLEGCKTVAVWSVEERRCSARIETAGLDMRSFAVSRCGRYFLSFSPLSSHLDLYDLVEGKRLHSYSCELPGIVCAAFSPSAKLLFTGSRDKTVKIWVNPSACYS